MIQTPEEALYALIAILLIWAIARAIKINISMFFARRAVMKNPSEENAWKVYKLLKAKLGVSINNHPKDWAKYRDMFYKINGSSQIPSELKENIKGRLMKKGLYIQNMRIVDNYRASHAHNNHMQEEMNRQFNEQAMEESRKAVTPFDHGGYVQGDGFNPSDTMAADAQRQMENMNQMNQMNDMNNMNNMF